MPFCTAICESLIASFVNLVLSFFILSLAISYMMIYGETKQLVETTITKSSASLYSFINDIGEGEVISGNHNHKIT